MSEFTVVVYIPQEGEVLLTRPLAEEDTTDLRHWADLVANQLEQEISDEGGFIPNCCGDIRVEIRRDPDNAVAIWSGQSFYFEH